MKINGVELKDINFFNAETADKLEEAMDKLGELANKDNFKGLSLGDSIRKQYKITCDVFDTIYGFGTGERVIGKEADVKKCFNALEPLVDQMKLAKNDMNRMTNKYSPNRAQRRNNTSFKFNSKKLH